MSSRSTDQPMFVFYTMACDPSSLTSVVFQKLMSQFGSWGLFHLHICYTHRVDNLFQFNFIKEVSFIVKPIVCQFRSCQGSLRAFFS